MIANYGYQDGSGLYYIRIDTDACVSCAARGCLAACPQRLFEQVVDDYDEEVVQVVEQRRRQLASDCAACKPVAGYVRLPCVEACPMSALQHSW
jgi:ferredoxin